MRRLCPRRLGSFVQSNARRLLLLSTLALLVLCVAINSARLDSELSSWIQRTSRIDQELKAIDSAVGDGAGSNSLLIVQTPRDKHNQIHKNAPLEDRDKANLLNVEALMIHLEAVAIAAHVTVDLYDVSWSLKDICFSATPPDYEGLLYNQMLEHLMPCTIKSPLDCFWEGAKLLGPDQDVRFSSIGPKLKWTSMNPMLMIEARQKAHPHASFPYATLMDWMKRVGITSGYQEKPCLDPSDPNCPPTAPNKESGGAPDVAKELTGGCYGLAVKQMHWKEAELIGGVERNKSGSIVRAEALQSTIQMMGERDLYDYWRKTSKVQDINNWSTDKAKLVLDLWQSRFKEELAQFTRSSLTADSYRISAMTPKSIFESIDAESMLDLAVFKTAFIVMTILLCLTYPSFGSIGTKPTDRNSNNVKESDLNVDVRDSIGRLKTILLAISTSILIALTTVASLGLSSFMNLPFNMASTQILPPLALYYGFKQALTVAHIYSRNFNQVPFYDLTTECLNQSLPTVILESMLYLLPLLFASMIPVQATRIFAFQVSIHIVLATVVTILLLPSLIVTFLTHGKSSDHVHYQSTITKRRSAHSPHKGDDSTTDDLSIEKIKEDLKNIKYEPTSSEISISAKFNSSDRKASIRVTTMRDHQIMRHNIMPDRECAHELPDLVTDLKPQVKIQETSEDRETLAQEKSADVEQNNSAYCQEQANPTKFLVTNKYARVLLVSLKVVILFILFARSPRVPYGLELKGIVNHGSLEYQSLEAREQYFPIFNVFFITKGNFDYPSNQKLMHEYYKRIERVSSILKRDSNESPKFWLVYFRDWLLELQDKFDSDRNNSLISNEGWTQDASDASKLAYKLLAQTGKLDHPIDKNQVESNRLVDSNGIINQKAFYQYLTAWVMNDAFSYSNSEANFRPEPKTWNDNPDDLRIEKARPLNYAQIPFTLKLPSGGQSLGAIAELRAISQAFEQLSMPNFPTGVPFIFWDQLINLDLVFLVLVSLIFTLLYLSISVMTSNLYSAVIIVLPLVLTLAEIYFAMGWLGLKFNNIVVVLLLGTIGCSTMQSIHYVMGFNVPNSGIGYTVASVSSNIRLVATSLILYLVFASVFLNSNLDFMIDYSYILFFTALVNGYNSILLIPTLLGCFASEESSNSTTANSSNQLPPTYKTIPHNLSGRKSYIKKKKRVYPRVQSEISLSTISEEPQSEARVHDLKLDLSIRCY